MRLQQKIFKVTKQNSEKVKGNDLPKLLLIINDKKTDIPVSKIFTRYKFASDFIKGWSILEYIEGNEICINDNKYKIELYHPESEDIYIISKVKNPTIQMNDIIIEQDSIDYLANIISSSSVQKETTEPQQSFPKGTMNVPKENENASDEPTSYKELIDKLKPKEYKEYKCKNYRLLYKDDSDSYVIVINKDDFNIKEAEIIDSTNESRLYRFYEDENKRLLLFNKNENSIIVINK